jgi:predicted GH43/DUF377 family glycosyl hydrolase
MGAAVNAIEKPRQKAARFACIALVPVLAMGHALSARAEDVSVDTLQHIAFHRVAGGASQRACLEVGPAGSWFSGTVGLPTVHFDGTTYRMWFTGDEPTKDAKAPYGIYQRIGLATSTDGLHWHVANNGQPVLDLGPPGSADAKGLTHPYVLKVGEEFWMWYGAVDGTLAGDLGLSPGSVRVERMCLAKSSDGVRWERANDGKPVLDIGPKGTIDGIQATGMHILKIGDEFKMWYGAYGSRQHTLVLATSPDGIRWTRHNNGEPIAGLVGGRQGQLGASVYFDGERYFMLYGGDKEGQWRTYAAVSDDGFHFTPISGETPILDPAPQCNFDTAGVGRNHVVHPSQFVVTNGKVRIWYMGEDGSPPHFQRIGLMEAALR